MREVKVEIAKVYVPMARRKSLDPARVAALAEDILENGQQAPILVRPDAERLVLVEGLHRLEACRALGDDTVIALMVQARKA
ncbi:MAG: ParB N-terminal domain-containing protein [Rhodospirillales bacterium]|jgi:ParB-like chromosome segregation protein Spo0J|nr:ParB N-terminal domain-containing protein [Rhodospirillales bacterium]